MRYDLNCDLGEGLDNEALLMPYISSCNIACGGHAGDAETIARVVRLALEQHVKIGAHPSFPDREHFGRQVLDMPDEILAESLREQILLVKNTVQQLGGTLHHVKAHGALYNLAMKDAKAARIVLKSIRETAPEALIYAPETSQMCILAPEYGIAVAYEVFADRNYNDDLSLVSRQLANAVITDPEAIVNHVYRMLSAKQVKTLTGNLKAIGAHTCCVHGDTAGAEKLVKYLNESLTQKGISIG